MNPRSSDADPITKEWLIDPMGVQPCHTLSPSPPLPETHLEQKDVTELKELTTGDGPRVVLVNHRKRRWSDRWGKRGEKRGGIQRQKKTMKMRNRSNPSQRRANYQQITALTRTTHARTQTQKHVITTTTTPTIAVALGGLGLQGQVDVVPLLLVEVAALSAVQHVKRRLKRPAPCPATQQK